MWVFGGGEGLGQDGGIDGGGGGGGGAGNSKFQNIKVSL